MKDLYYIYYLTNVHYAEKVYTSENKLLSF